jgi:hypothetical protein
MQFCEQCGSTSFDEQGFCRGCGARRAGDAVPADPSTGAKPASPLESKATIGSIPLAQPEVKIVWRAVLLALLLGPLGMLYCTYLGAAVMLFASIFAMFLPHTIVVWSLLQVICAVWAGLAARSANSIY